MSVIVKDLVKIFGEQRAVDSISFEAKKGEVLGFLGPNGAGKSTTMRMIGGFIPPNSGEISVCGINVLEDSLSSRAKIGYLPESNPLYYDMYVKEYLHFVASIHKIKQKKAKIDAVIEMTGLGREQSKLVGTLSKGYKQRVGLAQAMIHDPEVLILDEPTSGLDPNQLAEIRTLIKRLGEEKIVIFSTHIMQEVEALCDRVVIINKGQLVENSNLSDLHSKHQQGGLLQLQTRNNLNTELIDNFDGVQLIEDLGMNKYKLAFTGKSDLRGAFMQHLQTNEVQVLEYAPKEVPMEQIFQKLTRS
jgi:ABC-2 type transport system ATP-binding protein